ncbi:arginase family protein [Photobacterium galatheae]|uniref:Agmatinase n=1 Tax=Photobacterium galatheae TaxID=1654360 RepID=A0A066RTX1_9GAMM|nr:arginase family protein [Photobacterium galatheae]KDM91127.1 hypothetical protein EA58_13330 [Photobacterium galatheae]MCM0150151.1 arginase family protein [Photobacterium galatheae]
MHFSEKNNDTWQIHPEICIYLRHGHRAEIALEDFGIKISSSRKLAEVIDALNERDHFSVDTMRELVSEDVIDVLMKNYFVIPVAMQDLLKKCPVYPANHPVGQTLNLNQMDSLKKDDVVVFHAPVCSTTHCDVPVTQGGKWVRKFLADTFRCTGSPNDDCDIVDLDFGEKVSASDLHLYDLGDIAYDPMTETQRTVGERLSFLCMEICERQSKMIVLGGDHSQAFYTIQALSRRHHRIGVIQFDAHHDLYVSGNPSDLAMNHANVFHWVKEMAHVETIWQVGVRDIYPQNTHNVQRTQHCKVNTLSAYEARTRGFGRLIDALDPQLDWFISFDVDVLAGSDIPETATPVLGGLDYYTVLPLFERITRAVNVVGMEIVEVGEGQPSSHGAAAIAARLASRYIFSLRHPENVSQSIYAHLSHHTAE